MRSPYACGTADHAISRRALLGGVAAAWGGATLGIGGFLGPTPALAHLFFPGQKRVLNIFLE